VSSLDDYVSKEYEGAIFESTGSFTLSLQGALDKYGKYSAENPSSFVLRLVQFACCLGARAISVDDIGKQVLISVDVDTGSLDLGQCLEHDLLEAQGGWEGFLLQALLYALGAGAECIWLSSWHNGRQQELVCFPSVQKTCFSKVHQQMRAPNKVTLQVEKGASFALDADFLKQRLKFCPCPVYFTTRSFGLFRQVNDLRLTGWELPCGFESYSLDPFEPQILADIYCSDDSEASQGMLLRPPSIAAGSNRLHTSARVSSDSRFWWTEPSFPGLGEVPYRGFLESPGSLRPCLRLQGDVGTGKHRESSSSTLKGDSCNLPR